MTIPTQQSLTGFVATAPDLHFTDQGVECCRMRVGVEHWQKEADGSFTKRDSTFHDLVAFDRTARETYARFRPGDSFIASGHVHEYELTHTDSPSEIRDEFVARKIGHNATRTDYTVQRRRNFSPEPATATQPAPSHQAHDHAAPEPPAVAI